MRVSEQLMRAGVILKDTTHPGNIGSAARAMATMGLNQLVLVAPRAKIDETARAMSANGLEVLQSARQTETLPQALSAFTQVYAFSARRRDLSPRCLSPRQAAGEAVENIRQGGRAAFLFGGERSGLENEDIMRASAIVEIAANPSHPSLNLSHAVQIACYELRLACYGAPSETGARDLSTQEEFDAMIDHMQAALTAVGLPKANDTRPLIPRLRRLLMRADLEKSEVRLLRGIWRAMLATEQGQADNRENSEAP